MASFFSKPKSTRIVAKAKETQSSAAGPSDLTSEFQKTFKPFVLKKDITLAPINGFIRRGKGCPSVKVDNGVIIIEDDERVDKTDNEAEIVNENGDHSDVASLTVKGLYLVLFSSKSKICCCFRSPPLDYIFSAIPDRSLVPSGPIHRTSPSEDL